MARITRIIIKKLHLVLFVCAFIFASVVETVTDDKVTSFECIDNNNVPRLGNVPNPSPLNCSVYFTCETAPPDYYTPTIPSLARPCPRGANGPLFYDFRECECRESPSGCFDRDNNEDVRDFFKCTVVYDPNVDKTTEDNLLVQ